MKETLLINQTQGRDFVLRGQAAPSNHTADRPQLAAVLTTDVFLTAAQCDPVCQVIAAVRL